MNLGAVIFEEDSFAITCRCVVGGAIRIGTASMMSGDAVFEDDTFATTGRASFAMSFNSLPFTGGCAGGEVPIMSTGPSLSVGLVSTGSSDRDSVLLPLSGTAAKRSGDVMFEDDPFTITERLPRVVFSLRFEGGCNGGPVPTISAGASLSVGPGGAMPAEVLLSPALLCSSATAAAKASMTAAA
jgi:hypothetical protein